MAVFFGYLFAVSLAPLAGLAFDGRNRWFYAAVPPFVMGLMFLTTLFPPGLMGHLTR